MSRYKVSTTIGIVLATVLFAGCATPPKPVEELTRARTLLEQAEQAGGQQYAAADLRRARDKLEAADDAAEKGKDNARSLAVEAAADAELVVAKVRQAKAEDAAGELSKSLDSIKQESNRSVDKPITQ